MTIAAYYRPPNRTDQKYMDDTKAEMNKLKRKTGRNILTVAGDFNSPDIDWQTLTTTNKRYPSRVNQTYLDIVVDNDLEQMVDFPTRKDKTTLDIILTSHPSFKVRCKPLPSVGNSDHDIVLYDTALAPHRSRPPRRKIFLWKKADVEGMRQDVKEFANTYQYPDHSAPNALEQMWSDIKQMLSETVEKRVPSKTSAARHTNPWMTTSIRRAIRRKQRAHKKARMTGKKKDVDRYRRIQAQTRYEVQQASRKYLEDVEAEKLKSEAGSLDTSRYGEGGSRHSSGKRGLVSDMPGLEPAMPRLESAMPGLESAMPGLESAMPGLEPAMPGLEPAMPGLEGMPGLESAMPGLEGMPGLESALPGLEPAMPGLEPILPPLEPALPPLEPALPPLEPAMPGLEPAMPGLEPVAAHALGQLPAKRSFEVPTVLATNFRNDIDEASLASLFAVYCPKAIRIASTHTGRKKAFIEVGSVEDVKQAVTNLNQSFYNGHRIKVDVPFNLPELRRAVLGYDRLQASATGTVTLSEVLKLRGHILQNLQLPAFTFHLGQQVEVLITAVISDKFFWGQIIDRRMAEELQKISDSLNEPCKSEMVMNGPGRCKAKFEGDGKWYRAWVMRSSSACVAPQCRVFYLDYGNTAHIPWSHTARTPDRWHWSQPPLAIPFTLIGESPPVTPRHPLHPSPSPSP
ncbi:hypothetical protein ACOMHN_000015 [Nucella lapillus]